MSSHLDLVRFTELQDKGTHPAALVITRILPLSGRNPAEGHTGAESIIDRVDHLGKIAGRESDKVDPQLQAGFDGLLDHLVG